MWILIVFIIALPGQDTKPPIIAQMHDEASCREMGDKLIAKATAMNRHVSVTCAGPLHPLKPDPEA